MDGVLSLDYIKSSVAQVAPMFDLKKVTLFGSYASSEQTHESDIDLLVDFGSRPVGIYDIAAVKIRMEELTGKEVDVIKSPLSPKALIEIVNEVVLYEQKRR